MYTFVHRYIRTEIHAPARICTRAQEQTNKRIPGGPPIGTPALKPPEGRAPPCACARACVYLHVHVCTHWHAGLEAAKGRGAAGLLRGGGSLVHLGEHARHLHIQVQMYVNTRTHTHTHHHLIIILARMRAICITGRRHRMHSRRVQAPLFTRHSMRALYTALYACTPCTWLHLNHGPELTPHERYRYPGNAQTDGRRRRNA